MYFVSGGHPLPGRKRAPFWVFVQWRGGGITTSDPRWFTADAFGHRNFTSSADAERAGRELAERTGGVFDTGSARTRNQRLGNPGRGLSPRGTRVLLDVEAGGLPPPELYDGLAANRGGRIRVRKRGGRYSVTHEYGGGLPPMRMATDVDASAARNAAERLYGHGLHDDYDTLFRQVRRKANPRAATLQREAEAAGELVYLRDRGVWAMGPYTARTRAGVFRAAGGARRRTRAELEAERARDRATIEGLQAIAELAQRAERGGLRIPGRLVDRLQRQDRRAVDELRRRMVAARIPLPNIDAFTDDEGRIRPIRGSEGYDPDVEKIQREQRRESAREEMYRGVGRATMVESGVERPPFAWARGLSLNALTRIARDAGVSPYTYGWWDTANLVPGGKYMQERQGVGVQVKRRRSGEYQAAVLEGAHRGDVRRAARAVTRTGPRAAVHMTRAERIAARLKARASAARAAEDLPW